MHMMAVVDLEGNAVHPSVSPDVHDGICSTPTGKYSTPSEALDAHDVCCRLGGKCSPAVCFLMYMMAYAVHLLANTVHQVRLLINMMSVVDFVGNAVHQSVLPGVHDGMCSTPAGKYSTPSEAPGAHDGCCRLGGECSTHKCAS